MIKLLVGILFVAGVTTAGDYMWFEMGAGSHRMIAGVIHGAILLTTVGAVLGASAGRWLRGLPIGTIAGIGGALTYYALTGMARTGAMVAAWAMCWLILAALDGRMLRRPPRSFGDIVGRGITAAILGGLAFFLVVDFVWGHESVRDRNYLLQFLAWTVGWAPGILAIGIDRRRR
jgi:hypothetical protein